MAVLLIVEDDTATNEAICEYMRSAGHITLSALDGEQGLQIAREKSVDLVVLDIMLPKRTGLEVLKELRQTSNIPILMLTALDDEPTQAASFDEQADDYITKPFSVVEVLARIKANIRRTTQYDNNTPIAAPIILTAGDLVMNLSDYTVTKQGTPVELKAKEFDILKLLMQNPKKVYTKEQIYSLVWNDTYYGDENAVNVHISRLRSRIEDDTRNPRYVLTVWGIGYKLGDML